MDSIAKAASPIISNSRWGELEISIEGKAETVKDARLYPGGYRSWDWNEHGTSHGGGIQPGELDELLEHGTEYLVLSKGHYERLSINEETLNRLDKLGVEYDILPTPKAIEKYNQMAQEGKAVGALMHSTC